MFWEVYINGAACSSHPNKISAYTAFSPPHAVFIYPMILEGTCIAPSGETKLHIHASKRQVEKHQFTGYWAGIHVSVAEIYKAA